MSVEREAVAEVLWRRENPMATPDAWEAMMEAATRDPYLLTRWFDAADEVLTAVGDRYSKLETAAHSVVNAFYAKWTRGDMRGPIERLREVLSA